MEERIRIDDYTASGIVGAKALLLEGNEVVDSRAHEGFDTTGMIRARDDGIDEHVLLIAKLKRKVEDNPDGHPVIGGFVLVWCRSPSHRYFCTVAK